MRRWPLHSFYDLRMLNPRKGFDEARYFGLVMSVADVPQIRAKVLTRLVAAVEEEAVLRNACRDLDVVAATRVRAWWA